MNENESAIALIRKLSDMKSDEDCSKYICEKHFYRDLLTAIEALQEKQERDNPQPLTLEQLRERVGKPVWCSKNKQYGLIYTVSDEYYGIKFIDTCDTLKYFMTKPIYDRDPKENENG